MIEQNMGCSDGKCNSLSEMIVVLSQIDIEIWEFTVYHKDWIATDGV